MTDPLTKSALAAQLRTRFDVVDVDGLTLELAEVAGLPGAPDDEDSFALTFCAPGQAALPQTTYRLRHAVLGTLDVFLVPVRQDRTGLYLEAVFNRMPFPSQK